MPWCRDQCVLHCAVLCGEKLCVPSRPVVKTKMYRPVPSKKKCYRHFPSWKKLFTVRPRREKLYAPSRPAEQKNIYRPVPLWQFEYTAPSRHETKTSLYCTVPSRRENSHPPSRPVPSRQLYFPFFYRPGPSRFHFFFRQTF